MSVVDRLRELEAAATPGPWKPYPLSPWDDGTERAEIIAPDHEPAAMQYPDGGFDAADADLIATMRNALPALRDAVDGYRAAMQWLASHSLEHEHPGTAEVIRDAERILARLDDAAGQP